MTTVGYSAPRGEDVTVKDILNDTKRIEFHKAYLASLARAIRNGADVRGYFAWTLLDDFEWVFGYDVRFGFYYVDPHTLDRIPKLSVMWLRWENGDWGTLFRSSFGKVSDGSLKFIHLTPEETIIYNELTRDDAAKEINEDNVPPVEETSRMKKARLAGLDTRGKATEPIFLRKHKEPMGEASAEGAEAPSAPITVAAPAPAATGAFQPLWGFRRGYTVVGSTKHAWDWSYHGVSPKDFTDVVTTPDLERIKLMGAQSLASSNANFQGAVRQVESWKRASDKADNALRRQQKKYAALEKKFKRKEEELGESNAELVVLRAEKDKAIDNYLDSEEFTQSMRVRDDSVFPGFFRTGWDTTLGTVNEACPDINPADYVCLDDEALLQRFRTRVVVSDRIPQDPLLPPPE
ncbi:hypothetical protein AgCh_007409 [Apium graveolens]